jgi:hypothetical protein
VISITGVTDASGTQPRQYPSTFSGTMASSSQPSAKASFPAIPKMSPGEPSFICTICWHAQYAPSAPKLLGTSARIVCRACWRAVLDLSICWVCGEWIARGEEVVSLGWCFWHWGCFGCLICGMKMGLGTMERRRGKEGVQLNRIPLCVVCRVETSGQSKGQVLKRGLETVSRLDGGLGRERLEMLAQNRMTDGFKDVYHSPHSGRVRDPLHPKSTELTSDSGIRFSRPKLLIHRLPRSPMLRKRVHQTAIWPMMARITMVMNWANFRRPRIHLKRFMSRSSIPLETLLSGRAG